MPTDRPEDLDIQAALAAVEEPELRRSIVELGMVQGVAVDGRTAVVAIAAPLPGDASRAELRRRIIESVGEVAGIERVDVDLRDMTEEEIVSLSRLLKGVAPANPLQVVDASQARQPPPRINPFTDSRTRIARGGVGQGRCGEVVGHHQPLDRAGATAVARRGRRRRRVGLLDAAHARHQRPARSHRRRHRPAGSQRRAPHLDGLLRPRGPGRHLAGPDVAQGARAIPHRRVLGRARLPRRRHASGHRRHLVVDRGVPAARRGARGHHAATRGAARRRARGGDGREGRPAGDRCGREHVVVHR